MDSFSSLGEDLLRNNSKPFNNNNIWIWYWCLVSNSKRFYFICTFLFLFFFSLIRWRVDVAMKKPRKRFWLGYGVLISFKCIFFSFFPSLIHIRECAEPRAGYFGPLSATAWHSSHLLKGDCRARFPRSCVVTAIRSTLTRELLLFKLLLLRKRRNSVTAATWWCRRDSFICFVFFKLRATREKLVS